MQERILTSGFLYEEIRYIHQVACLLIIYLFRLLPYNVKFQQGKFLTYWPCEIANSCRGLTLNDKLKNCI